MFPAIKVALPESAFQILNREQEFVADGRSPSRVEALASLSYLVRFGGFLKNRGTPEIIHFNGMFHYKPPSLGTHLWNLHLKNGRIYFSNAGFSTGSPIRKTLNILLLVSTKIPIPDRMGTKKRKPLIRNR